MPAAPSSSVDWPGKRLSLPESGSRSIGRIGRRIGAILVDWAIASLLSYAFFRPDPNGLWTLAIFLVLQILFLVTVNGSVGHLVFGLRLVPIVPGYLGAWRPVVRTVLLAIVIPAVIYDRDQRGLHDRWAGTILVRR